MKGTKIIFVQFAIVEEKIDQNIVFNVEDV